MLRAALIWVETTQEQINTNIQAVPSTKTDFLREEGEARVYSSTGRTFVADGLVFSSLSVTFLCELYYPLQPMTLLYR